MSQACEVANNLVSIKILIIHCFLSGLFVCMKEYMPKRAGSIKNKGHTLMM
jgi:hypothetical protein